MLPNALLELALLCACFTRVCVDLQVHNSKSFPTIFYFLGFWWPKKYKNNLFALLGVFRGFSSMVEIGASVGMDEEPLDRIEGKVEERAQW